jgi:hypothetical protein
MFPLSLPQGLSLTLDGSTGLLKSVSRYNKELGKEVGVEVSQNFHFYEAMAGENDKFEDRASGAYIFRPNGSEPLPVSRRATFTVYRGEDCGVTLDLM